MSNINFSLRLRFGIAVAIILISATYHFYNQPRNSVAQNPISVSPTALLPSSAPELASGSCHARGLLPDMSCTPGAVNAAVNQSNLDQTICRSGYSKSVRPPASYTDKLKASQMAAYGYTDSLTLHEEDHLISLELGGDPTNPKNLWPEPGHSPNPKDSVENNLHAAVCNGRITLIEAQTRIATDWTTAEAGI
jgi:hypothetical protein